MSDEMALTRRELEIIRLLAEGLSNDEIAVQLVISPNTVKVHMRNIFEKMGVQSRTEATMEAVRRGWITIPGLEPRAAEGEPLPEPLPVWPPLVTVWRSWQWLALLAALCLGLAMAFWPNRSPAPVVAAAAAGFTTERGSASLTPLSREETPRWTPGPAMFTPRSRAAGALIDGRLYVVGGESSTGDTDTLEMYDSALATWQRLAPRPVAARGAAAAATSSHLYVAGGCTDGAALARVDRYDPAANTWDDVAPLPAGRCGLALVAIDQRLFAFGGWDGRVVSASLYIYDSAADRWQEGRPMPAPRAFAGAVAVREEIYVLGGHNGSQQTAEMWVYHPADNTWTLAPSLPEPRAGIAVAAEPLSLYVIGGGEQDQPSLHERFDLMTQSWSTIDSPRPGPWRQAVAAMIGPNLHVVGGWNGDYLAAHEVYQASHLLFLPIGAQGAH